MIDTIEIDERIAKCEKILAVDKNSQIFAALAEAYRKKGDLQKAQDICINGLKKHPNYASARVVMAKIQMIRGDYDAAWGELKKAVSVSGRSRAIDILESEILIHKGKSGKAKVILERLYTSDPDDDIVKNLMTMLSEGTSRVALPDTSVPESSIDSPKKREFTLSEVVSILKVMPRVLGVAAVSHNGLVLDARFDAIYSEDEVAALSKSIHEMSSSGSDRVGIGITREILIETQSSKLWIFCREQYLLVIFARDDVNVGSLKMKIDSLLKRVTRKPVDSG